MYYHWVNIDKKEYITPRDFDYGNKFHESMNKDSAPLTRSSCTPS